MYVNEPSATLLTAATCRLVSALFNPPPRCAGPSTKDKGACTPRFVAHESFVTHDAGRLHQCSLPIDCSVYPSVHFNVANRHTQVVQFQCRSCLYTLAGTAVVEPPVFLLLLLPLRPCRCQVRPEDATAYKHTSSPAAGEVDDNITERTMSTPPDSGAQKP